MDLSRFDRLTRILGAIQSRRTVGRAALGSLVGLLSVTNLSAKTKRKKKRKCKGNAKKCGKKCCPQGEQCLGRRCAPYRLKAQWRISDNGRATAIRNSLRSTADISVDSASGIALDSAGNVYVGEQGGGGVGMVHEFTSDGTVVDRWQSSRWPLGLAVDSAGNIYVADPRMDHIQKYDSNTALLATWGGFQSPMGVAIDDAGRVVVSDLQGIHVFDAAGERLDGWDCANSRYVAVDASGNIYVTVDDAQAPNRGAPHIRVFSPEGTALASWGDHGQGPGEFLIPQGIAVDPRDGGVIAIDGETSRIQKFDTSGRFLVQWGRQGSASGEFQAPYGVVLDGSGNIYVADGGNNRVTVFAPV